MEGRVVAPKKQDNDRPTFADVARVVAGGTPPLWLVEGLTLYGNGVAMARETDAMSQTLTERHDRLLDLSRAAALIHGALLNVEILSYLEHPLRHSPVQLPLPSGFLDVLAFIATPEFRAAMVEVERRARLEAAGIKIRDGRSPPGPRVEGTDASRTCAFVIVEAWTAARGTPPGSSTTKAHEAADAYWRAADGPAIGGDGSVAGWRRRFEDMVNFHTDQARNLREAIRAEFAGLKEKHSRPPS